jgi:hypothetical protein
MRVVLFVHTNKFGYVEGPFLFLSPPSRPGRQSLCSAAPIVSRSSGSLAVHSVISRLKPLDMRFHLGCFFNSSFGALKNCSIAAASVGS